jgi:transposase
MNSIDQFIESEAKVIRRNAQKIHNEEEKIRIVIEGIRNEISINELCLREGIDTNLFYKWSREFMETNRGRFVGDTRGDATPVEVHQIKNQNMFLRRLVAELSRENNLLKNRLNCAS